MMNRLILQSLVMMGGLLAACPAMAGQWLVDCGDHQINLGTLESSGPGPKSTITISDYNEATRSFVMHLHPKNLGTEERAAGSAFLMADLTVCPYLDGHAVPVKASVHTDEAWVFLAGCQGHSEARKELCK